MSKLMTARVDEYAAINLRAKGVLNHGPGDLVEALHGN